MSKGRIQWIKTIGYGENECPLFNECNNAIKQWRGEWLLCQCVKDKIGYCDIRWYRPKLTVNDDGDDYYIACHDAINQSKEVILERIRKMKGVEK